MKETTDFLNEISRQTGITDRNEVISLGIGLLVKNGMPVDRAIESVFGPGSFDRVAGRIFQALRGK